MLILNMSHIDTPLGRMVALASKDSLYLLEFESQKGLRPMQSLFEVTRGENSVIDAIKGDLQDYFRGNLIEFTTPIFFSGTPFQKEVWNALKTIPYGKTISYAELATLVGSPKACRAVGSANGSNRFAIMIPCHRVINAGGKLGGYAGGIERKAWLLQHEKLL